MKCCNVWSKMFMPLVAVACCLAIPSAAWAVQTEQVKLLPVGGGATENFGDNVAIDGNTIVGGAYMATVGGVAQAGAAYVYEGGGASWTQTQKLSSGVYGRMTYNAIGLDGDTMVCGATKGNTAYVFDRVGSTWSLSQTLTGTTSVGYGKGAALQGGTMAVADPDAPSGGVSGVGQIDIFEHDGTSWARVQILNPSDPATADNFGYRISIDGDRLVTGAYSTDDNGILNCGAAYIFEKQDGFWTETARLVASDAVANQYFGYDVALQGDTVIVGASQDPVKGSNAGAAYVFKYDGTTWNETQKLFASDAATKEKFGAAVDIDGQSAVIGACSTNGPGAAYVFTKSGGSWSESVKLVASDAAANDRFGYDAVLDGLTVVVGAYGDDNACGTDAGALYVFAIPEPGSMFLLGAGMLALMATALWRKVR